MQRLKIKRNGIGEIGWDRKKNNGEGYIGVLVLDLAKAIIDKDLFCWPRRGCCGGEEMFACVYIVGLWAGAGDLSVDEAFLTAPVKVPNVPASMSQIIC